MLLDPNTNLLISYTEIIRKEKQQGHALIEYKTLGKDYLADIYMYFVADLKTPITNPLSCIASSKVNWTQKQTEWGINLYNIWKGL